MKIIHNLLLLLIIIIIFISCKDVQECLIVDTPNKLSKIRDDVDKDVCYRITKDLDLDASGDFWQPVGSMSEPFQAKIYGGGHTISNLRINSNRDSIAFIVATGSDALIEKLSFSSCSIQGSNYLATVVAHHSGSLFQVSANCNVHANNSGDYVGGLVAENNGNIRDSSIQGSIQGRNYVGGVAGKNNSQINGGISNVMIMGQNYLGGIVGENTAKINKSSATADVSGSNIIGSLVGNNTEQAEITNSYASGMAEADATSNIRRMVSGFVGVNAGTIINSYTIARTIDLDAVGTNRAAPFVFSNSGTIQQSYWNRDSSGIVADNIDGTEHKTTDELQCAKEPGDADCDLIYQGWSEAIWNFRTSAEYPIHR